MSTATATSTIMVAEDDTAVRELLTLALEASGFNAIAVSNIGDAIAQVESKKVDLILLDLALGEESGVELLKRLRHLPQGAKMPVILLTGRSDRNTVFQVAQLGVQGYVLKAQMSRSRLMDQIRVQIGNRESTTSDFSKTSSAQSVLTVDDVQKCSNTASVSSQCLAENASGDEPIITREQAIAQADKCAELKALSPTVAQLMSITGSADYSLEQIARVIARDPAITLKVLRIANSVVYNRGGTVDTVQKALSKIGTSQVRQLASNISVIDSFRLRDLGEHFNNELFWEHSIATGLIAATITRFRRGDEGEIDRAFTMGLLHDVGRLVFVEQLGEIYKRVLDTAARLRLPLEQAESKMLLLNHAELMQRVLTAWKFPEAIIEPVSMHHLSLGNIRSLAPRIVEEVSTIAVANRFAHAMLLGSSGNDCQYPTSEFARFLNLKKDVISFIEERIPEQTTEMKAALVQSDTSAPRDDFRQTVLKRFKRPIRPLYVSDDVEVDGYRILFDRLRQTTGGRRANVAVLYLPNPNDRETLFTKLRNQEIEAGMQPLPLIVISGSPDVEIESRLVAGRMHEVIPAPFGLARLADTVNRLLPPEKGH